MSRDESEDNTTYKVVVNHEEQYSIWPADRENALGWKDAGFQGRKSQCLTEMNERRSAAPIREQTSGGGP